MLLAVSIGGEVCAETGRTSALSLKVRSWGYQLQNVDRVKLGAVPYDVIVIDDSRDGSDDTALTAEEVRRLKVKPDGSRHVVLSCMSIGEADGSRDHWNPWWSDWWFVPNLVFAPNWRAARTSQWGSYAVRYWDPAWQEIILGARGYMDRSREEDRRQGARRKPWFSGRSAERRGVADRWQLSTIPLTSIRRGR